MMTKRALLWLPGVLVVMQVPGTQKKSNTSPPISPMKMIELPAPKLKGAASLEEALSKRRSVRAFSKEPVTIQEISQLLWAAQGVTEKNQGLRTAPSAGALYPLEIYAVLGRVVGLPKGVYKYFPQEHGLVKIVDTDPRKELSRAALDQESVRDAPVVLVLSAVIERTAVKYGTRATRYVHMEGGHAAQNVYLQAAALKLGTVVVGAFYDKEVRKVIGMDSGESALYIMPIGRPKK